MVVLNLTEILPAPIQYKERDNDILLITAKKHQELYPETRHIFVLTIPFVSIITSFLYPQWSSYRTLWKQGFYTTHNHNIQVMALFMRGYRFAFMRSLLNWSSYQFNKKRLIKKIKNENVSIIHAHNIQHSAYIAQKLSKKLSIPYVITSRKAHNISKYLHAKGSLKNASSVISINHIHKKKIDEVIPPSKSYLIPHGIDEKFLHYYKTSYENKNPIRIITICRLINTKNIDTVIFSLKKIKQSFIYHIYGEGPEIERYKKILRQSNMEDKVEFMGYIEHNKLPEILCKYDIFVMPSYPEVFGRVYLEAMSIGLPIIASKNTGMDGYIKNGESGFLVDHTDLNILSETLSLLIDNHTLRKHIGTNARKTAALFSWEKIINQLHHVYKSSIYNT